MSVYFSNRFNNLPTALQEYIFEFAAPLQLATKATAQNDVITTTLNEVIKRLWKPHVLYINNTLWFESAIDKWLYENNQNEPCTSTTLANLSRYLLQRSPKKPFPNEIHPQYYIKYLAETEKSSFIAEYMGPSGPVLR